MLTKRQFILRKKIIKCIQDLEPEWERQLKNVKHPGRWMVQKYRYQTLAELEKLGPWLFGEQFSLREIERITRPVSGIELILNPVIGSHALNYTLLEIANDLPKSLFDHLPFSGLTLFLKWALP